MRNIFTTQALENTWCIKNFKCGEMTLPPFQDLKHFMLLNLMPEVWYTHMISQMAQSNAFWDHFTAKQFQFTVHI